MGQGIDIRRSLVAADGFDPGEAERKTAVVAFAGLDAVEANLQHQIGHDGAAAPLVVEGMLFEMGGEFLDFEICQAAVGFTDHFQLPGGLILDCEGVVTQHMAAFAMALLGGGDHDIKTEGTGFEFQPRLAAAPGGVRTVGVFDDESLVAGCFGREKGRLDGLGGGRVRDGDALESLWQDEGFQQTAAFGQGFLEQRPAIQPEQVEDDKTQGDFPGHEEVGFASAQTLLEIEEAEFPAFRVGDDFAIKDHFLTEAGGLLQDFRELGFHLPEVAGKDGRPVRGAVQLGADAVKLGFQPDPRGSGGRLTGRRVRMA